MNWLTWNGLAAVAGASFVAAFAAACASTPVRVEPAHPSHGVSYRQVHAIFRDTCEHCHNAEKAEGGLLLDSYEALLAGGESGTPIKAGESASSLLIQVVEGKVKPRMPYKEEPLSSAEIDLIRRWIDDGAAGPPVGAGATAEVDREVEIPDVKPRVPVLGAVAAVAFDLASHRMAAGSYRSVYLMSLSDRKWSGTLGEHADLVRAVAFSPDGKRLAVAGGPSGRFGEIKIWDVQGASARPVTTIRGHEDAILTIAFSPDGTAIASGSYDKLVKIWDTATGREIRTLKEHSDAVYSVAFMPDGRQVVSGAGDRTLKVWDVSTGKRLFTIGDSLDAVYTVAVHPSGARIAAAGADRTIRTWSWNGDATAALLSSTFAHSDAVLRLAYSPDGTTLVSTGADRAIKLWDGAALREQRLLEAQPDWVMGLALSADGQWLAAGRYDGTLGLYSMVGNGSGEHFVIPQSQKD